MRSRLICNSWLVCFVAGGLMTEFVRAAEPVSQSVVGVSAELYQAGPDGVTPDLEKIDSRLQYIYRVSEENYKFSHHPCLIAFRDTLFCIWSNGKIGEDEPGQRLAISSSSDAKHWSAAGPLLSKEQLQQYQQHVFVATGLIVREEKLVAFYTITPGKNFHQETALYFSESTDGKRWSDPYKITDGFFINPPVVVKGGRLLMGGEYVSETDRETKRSKLIYHDGQSLRSGWTVASIEEGDLKRIGYAEPNFIDRQDDVIGLFRNYTGRLLVSRSVDRGQSWEPLSSSQIPDSTARFATGNLPSGVRYLVGNTLLKKFDRRVLLISLSDDQGETFSRAFVIRDEETEISFAGQHKMDGWQYPHGYVWKDQLLIVHSVNKEDVAISSIKLQSLEN